MSSNFQKFIDRLSNHQIKEIWKNHPGVKRKFFDYLYEDLLKYKNPIILEFGVRHGISTSMFLDVCKQNDGFLYSIDINDYSYKFEKKKWKFIKSKDNDFLNIEKQIPNNFDIIFLDTIHKADHVNDILNYYYDKLNKGGFFLIDDISWLLYTKNAKYDNFFREVNNKETFNRLLSIYSKNSLNFNISFNFCDTGLAKITKLNNNKLNNAEKIVERDNSIKNILRKIYLKFKT